MYLILLVLPTSEGNFVTCSWCSNRVPENRAERLFGNALKQVHFRGEECIPSHATAVQFATQHSFSFSFKSVQCSGKRKNEDEKKHLCLSRNTRRKIAKFNGGTWSRIRDWKGSRTGLYPRVWRRAKINESKRKWAEHFSFWPTVLRIHVWSACQMWVRANKNVISGVYRV